MKFRTKRQRLKDQREREADHRADLADPRYQERLEIAKEFGCDINDLGECMKCSSPWPSGMKNCPECGWDGIDMRGVH